MAIYYRAWSFRISELEGQSAEQVIRSAEQNDTDKIEAAEKLKDQPKNGRCKVARRNKLKAKRAEGKKAKSMKLAHRKLSLRGYVENQTQLHCVNTS